MEIHHLPGFQELSCASPLKWLKRTCCMHMLLSGCTQISLLCCAIWPKPRMSCMTHHAESLPCVPWHYFDGPRFSSDDANSSSGRGQSPGSHRSRISQWGRKSRCTSCGFIEHFGNDGGNSRRWNRRVLPLNLYPSPFTAINLDCSAQPLESIVAKWQLAPGRQWHKDKPSQDTAEIYCSKERFSPSLHWSIVDCVWERRRAECICLCSLDVRVSVCASLCGQLSQCVTWPRWTISFLCCHHN